MVRFALLSLCALVSIGCASLPRNPLPLDQIDHATIPGMEDVRAIGMRDNVALRDDLVASLEQEDGTAVCYPQEARRDYCILIISGGGGYGAFGAGILNGWSRSGTRPTFKMVTGVSTGSLIAPFAFLGPEYDPQLREAYTTISDERIYSFRGPIAALFSESFADSQPLAELISEYVDEEFLRAIAREHERGRRLYVGTTNMDAQKFVVWDMGAIAASGHPGAVELFRQVVLASSSVPTALPPVYITVESGGRVFDEMHADGGVISQFFMPDSVVDLSAMRAEMERSGTAPETMRLFVIRNARFAAAPERVDRNLEAITTRAISTMIQAMGISDLYRIYAISTNRGVDFNFVEVPEDFIWQGKGGFDQEEMNRLFEVGFRLAQTEDAWSQEPPGLFSRNIRPLE